MDKHLPKEEKQKDCKHFFEFISGDRSNGIYIDHQCCIRCGKIENITKTGSSNSQK